MKPSHLNPKSIILKEKFALVPLTKGHYAIIDFIDIKEVGKYNWWLFKAKNCIYASRTENKKNIFLHNFIMKPENNQEVDHKNHNTLDNRRENLRIGSHQQNVHNKDRHSNKKTSKYKGVFKNRNLYKKWFAQICIDYKQIWLGAFYNEEEAARVYDEAAIKYHGEFACTNKSLGLFDNSVK